MQKTILIISLVTLAGCWKSDFKSLKALAEKGVPRAQHELGRMYHDGTEVEQNFKESFKWTRKAAEQNQHKTNLTKENFRCQKWRSAVLHQNSGRA